MAEVEGGELKLCFGGLVTELFGKETPTFGEDEGRSKWEATIGVRGTGGVGAAIGFGGSIMVAVGRGRMGLKDISL